MTDLTSVAREAARAEAIRRDHVLTTLKGHEIVDDMGDGFIDGFTECASRLPSEEELAEAIAAGYDSVYAHRLPVNEHDLRAARAVRALIGEKISG